MLGGWAGPRLLETYEQERRPVAVRPPANAPPPAPPSTATPATRAPAGGGPQKGVLAVALGYRYPRGAVLGADPDGPVVPEDFRPTGEPGGRAPHLWVTGRDGVRRSTLDLYERSMVLLTGDGAAGAQWQAAARTVARRTGVPLECHRIGTGPDADLVPEADADWAALHGTTVDAAVLVRPDGFVAWRAEAAADDPCDTLTVVLDAVLRRN